MRMAIEVQENKTWQLTFPRLQCRLFSMAKKQHVLTPADLSDPTVVDDQGVLDYLSAGEKVNMECYKACEKRIRVMTDRYEEGARLLMKVGRK